MSAVSALNAFRGMGFEGIVINGSHHAGLLADPTLIAVLANPAFEETQGRDQAEQGAQGTEGAAPKPWSQTIEGNDPPKDQKRDGRHVIERLRIAGVGEGDPSQCLKQGTEQIQT